MSLAFFSSYVARSAAMLMGRPFQSMADATAASFRVRNGKARYSKHFCCQLKTQRVHDEATLQLSHYIAGSQAQNLPAEVLHKTKLHILDTIAAIVSGSRLKPGQFAASFVQSLGGRPEALLLGTDIVAPAIDAALANGMAGHADETDDSHLRSRSHPGCAVVPAALAVAERYDSSGLAFAKAVVAGYDVGARSTMALGYGPAKTHKHSTHSLAATFGAAAAAASLTGASTEEAAYVLSYAAQQASGVTSWNRDDFHIEKAFDFGGMGARNGVFAALFVAAGASGVSDVMTGNGSYLEAFGEKINPEALTRDLGTVFEVMNTSIKKWSVGSPIQAALDSLVYLMHEHRVRADDVERVVAHMPDDRLHVVSDRGIPDICLQHLLALTLTDGTLTFASSHDEARMHDPAVLAMRARVTAVPSAELTAAKPSRQANIELILRDGRRVERRTRAVLGTPDNPMSEADVRAKADDLLQPILGAARSRKLIDTIMSLETVVSMLDLRPLLKAN
jgi:2-methylcitrate dehydratase PrpD